jgi:hypothetical protein
VAVGARKWSLRSVACEPSRVVSRFVRRVRTSSGAVAVQIVTRRGRHVERIEHVGSAHSGGELALLLASARERLRPGQDALDLGEVPALAARLDEVADWTVERRAPGGQQVLEAPDTAAVPVPPRSRSVANRTSTRRRARQMMAALLRLPSRRHPSRPGPIPTPSSSAITLPPGVGAGGHHWQAVVPTRCLRTQTKARTRARDSVGDIYQIRSDT